MAVAGIDHVNIRTTDPERSARFYERALGLTYRLGPVVMGNQAHWLFDDEGNHIIHLRIKQPEGSNTGSIDHVALRCDNRPAMKARLDDAGIEPSVASVGDSYDNALAETINGLYKAEVIHPRGPWRSFEAEQRYYAMLDDIRLAALI